MMPGGTTRSFAIPQSGCGAPATALAYSLNVTVIPAGPLSFLSLWPTGQQQPFVSTLNSFGGIVVANAAIVPAGTDGAVSFTLTAGADMLWPTNWGSTNAYLDGFLVQEYGTNVVTVCTERAKAGAGPPPR